MAAVEHTSLALVGVAEDQDHIRKELVQDKETAGHHKELQVEPVQVPANKNSFTNEALS